MFYAQTVLAKKGQLAQIWLAAHWEQKLTKTQILKTDISKSVETILRYHVGKHGTDPHHLSLRLQAHLLVGLVRIHQRKVKYLLEDCNMAIIKLKSVSEKEKSTVTSTTTRAKNIDLQKEQTSAHITLRPADITLESQDIDIGQEFQVEDETVWPIQTATRHQITMASRDERMEEIEPDFLQEEDYQPGIEVGGPDYEPQTAMDREAAPGVDVPVPDRDILVARSSSSEDERSDDERKRLSSLVEPGSPSLLQLAEGQEPPSKRQKVKRHAKFDESDIIDKKEMERRLKDTANIVREIAPAPSSRKEMQQRQAQIDGPIAQLHAPIIEGLPEELIALFSRTMSTGVLGREMIPSQQEEIVAELQHSPTREGEEEVYQPGLEGVGAAYEEEEEEPPVAVFEPTEYETEPPVATNLASIRALFKSWFDEETGDYVKLLEKLKDHKRMEAAQIFFGLLHFKTAGEIDVSQHGKEIRCYRTKVL